MCLYVQCLVCECGVLVNHTINSFGNVGEYLLPKRVQITITHLCIFNAIFHGFMNSIFETKICNIFLIYGSFIDCGYLLEPPQ